MAVTWVDPPTKQTISGAASWVDVDVSGTIPSGDVGVIVHLLNIDTAAKEVGVRKNGSTDDRHPDFIANTHGWACIGVDGSGIFEIYAENTTDIEVYLVGSFSSDMATFQTNADDVSITSPSFTDIDISTITVGETAIAAMLDIITATNDEWALRKNGSTDNRPEQSNRHSHAIIGCDGSEIFEGKIDTDTADFFLVGWLTQDATFPRAASDPDATDVSLGSTGTYVDLTSLPSGAGGGAYEIFTTGAPTYALRKDGTSEDLVQAAKRHKFALVEAASLVVEGKISATTMDFFEVGHFAEAVAAGRIMSSLAGSGGLAGKGGIAGPGGGLAGA
jgi:hypothetical protein